MKRALLGGAIAALLSSCSHMPGHHGDNWVSLFDGRGIANFDVLGDANWRVVDGAIVADKGSGFLVSKNDYADFEIRAEFYAEADTNSGIFVRCNQRQKIDATNCYEVNIWDARPKPEYGTGAIVDIAAVTPSMPKAGGKWNSYEIHMKGDHLVVMLNGVKTVDVRNARNTKGPICLQYAPGNKKDSGLPIKFRKVQVRAI